jgi:hypothetical protein
MRIIELPSNVQKFVEYCKNRFDLEIKIKNKNQPEGLYRIVRRIVSIFNSDFEKKYITVLFGDVWVPGDWFDDSGRLSKNEMHVIEIMMHEMVHEKDRNNFGNFIFSAAYLFPQCLGILGFFGIFGFLLQEFFWFILFFLFLLPIPSPTRAWLELRGYRINVEIANLFNGSFYAEEIARTIYRKQFKGPSYYWMFPFLERKIVRELTDLQNINNFHKEMINWFNDTFNIK